MVGWALRAGRQDHYQTQQDRLDLLRLFVKWWLILSIAMPVSISTQLVLKLIAPDTADTLEPVITSVYTQVMGLALLWHAYRYRVYKIDFDVYKQNPQPT